ncbi:hypothetical protein [Mobiluncus mulieris]|uniref:hypothetical protein n=1 Tax=Mobiluncus mulieris TaxID=2052 RepID=UPI0020167213|nr:hypothetical protein [Mobiluncus mulieris]
MISGFFGTGWPIWLQVWVLFPEIVTNHPAKPKIIPVLPPKLHTEPALSRIRHQNCAPARFYPGFVAPSNWADVFPQNTLQVTKAIKNM